MLQRRASRGPPVCSLAVSLVVSLGLAGCAAPGGPLPEAQARERAAVVCRGAGGIYIAEADVQRGLGEGGVGVTLPGPDWCEVARGPEDTLFLHFAHLVARLREGRPATTSDRAQTFFLALSRPGPADLPAEAPRDLRALRAALDAERRAGGVGRPAPRYMAWEDGSRFRVRLAEVGTARPGGPCVPARLVHEERDNPRFPPGTMLRLVWEASFCLLPASGGSPRLVMLQASERRLEEDPAADPLSAARAALAERFFASFRAGAPR